MGPIYRVYYVPEAGGYVVYRHVFDEQKCHLEDGVLAHRTATFITSAEAGDYAAYRNRQIDVNGSDELRHHDQ